MLVRRMGRHLTARSRTVAADGSSVGLIDVVVTVVDLASGIDLPVGVVRVLLSDLGEYGIIRHPGRDPGGDN